MTNALLVALLASLLVTAGPSRAATREFTLDVGGRVRSYIVHVPESRRKGKLPLVVLMHGGGGNARQAMRAYGMSEVADREGFLVAYPNGSGRRQNSLLTWNAGNCCAYSMNQGIDDVAFIRAMVEKIDRDFGVDRSRIFATGMSNGAMMAYRLACEASDLVAAIAPVAGALNIPCHPSDAVAVVIFHGTADLHVPYDGGIGPKARERRVDQPVSHAVELWRTANGCTRPTGPVKRGSIITRSWNGCRDGTEVRLYTIEGGGHSWPGGAAPRRRAADPPARELNASEVMWQFFEAHPKR